MATHDDVDLTICLTGPECTGKTTLAHALADRLGAAVVPEIARSYLEGRSGYGREDVLEIARRQIDAEADARATHRGLLICDTDLVVIQIWLQEKYGALPEIVTRALAARSQRGYLLLEPDLPWVNDPLRENRTDRDRLFGLYRNALEAGPFPYRRVTGLGDTRTRCAEDHVGSLIEDIR